MRKMLPFFRADAPLLPRHARQRPRGPDVPPTRPLEPLEPRLLLTHFDPHFVNVPLPNGITADLNGNIWVARDIYNLFPPDQAIDGFTPAGIGPLRSINFFGAAGRLATLPTDAHMDRYHPLGPLLIGVNAGDLLHLQLDGTLTVVRPSTGASAQYLNLRTLATDTTSVFDGATGLMRDFSGSILPQSASYSDLAVFQTGTETQLWVSGISGAVSFIMRVGIQNGYVQNSEVVVSSIITVNHAPGVAVNDAGTVLTTMGTVNRDTGVPRVLAFGADFDRTATTDDDPRFPFTMDMISRGMAVGPDGDFVIATGGVNSSLCGAMPPGYVRVSAALDVISCSGFVGATVFESHDVVVSNNIAYVTVASATLFGSPNGTVARFEYGTAGISGIAYEDLNANGLRDAGEPMRPGVSVGIDITGDGLPDGNKPTDAQGRYEFRPLVAGVYRINQALPSGWLQSQPATPSWTVVLDTDSALQPNAHFGAYRLGSISGAAYEDRNGNNQRDPGEPPLAGVTVFLDSNSNGSNDNGEPAALTDAAGAYSLSDITPGNRTLRYAIPQHYISTAPTGPSRSVQVTSGLNTSAINFGSFPTRFAGTSGDDVFAIRAAPGGSVLQIFNDPFPGPSDTPAFSISRSLLGSLNFDLGPGDDLLTLDFVNQSPLPPGGLQFNGGPNAGPFGDALVTLGTSANDVITTEATQITVNGAVIPFSGVEVLEPHGGRFTPPTGTGDDRLTVRSATPFVYFVGGDGNDTLNIDAITHRFEYDSSLDTTNLSVNVMPGGAAIFESTQHLNALTINPTGRAELLRGSSKSLVTNNLTISPGATLDLHDHDLLVRTSSIAEVNALVRSARNPSSGPRWSGPGITSSNARDDLSGLTGLVVVPTPDGVLVKYSWAADATGDGQVTADDLFRIDRGFLGRRTLFHDGNFDFDEDIDLDDYALIDAAYLGQSRVFA